MRPVFSGEIPSDGVVTLLHRIEQHRTTGRLRFVDGDVEGEVALVAGQIATEQQPMPGGQDPVEALLARRAGRYEVFQQLPPIPVSQGGHERRQGSLTVHVPADLMSYCERVGLTGTLTLEEQGRRAEVFYDRGDLVGIRLEGSRDDDLQEVFGWQEGSFELEAHPSVSDVDLLKVAGDDGEQTQEMRVELPEEPPRPRTDDTGQHFLQVVEVELSRIVAAREAQRPAHRRESLPPLAATRRPRSIPAPPEESRPVGRSSTVRVVYLRPGTPSSNEGLRHVDRGHHSDSELPEAAPERRRDSEPATRRESNPELDRPRSAGGAARDGGWAVAVGWTGVFLLILVAALAFIARLPPLE